MKPRLLKRLAGFTKTDLQEIAQHLETHTYVETIAMIATRWQRQVPKSTLERFRRHHAPYLAILSASASVEVSSDLAEYAASAQANFNPSTLFLLEQQAFQIALHRQNGDDLDEFKDLFLLSQKARTTIVRERMLEIQDRKCRVRETESQHKIQRDLKREEKAKEQEEEESPERKQERIQEKLWDIFGVPEEERVKRRARREDDFAQPSEQSSAATPSINPPIHSYNNSGSDSAASPTIHNSDTSQESHSGPVPSNEKCSTLDPRAITAQFPKAENSPESQPQIPGIIDPSIRTSNHPSPEALAAAVNNYTVRRGKEYWAHRRSITGLDPLARIPEYQSTLRECPCGCALPCPHHKPFPDEFWKISPHSSRYCDELLLRDLPYREPIELLS